MSTSLPRARLGSGAGASPRSSPRTRERGQQHQSNTVSGVALEQQKSSQRVNKPVRAGQTVKTEQVPGELTGKEQQKVQIDVVGDMRGTIYVLEQLQCSVMTWLPCLYTRMHS